ncbi:rod shape-determining protein MreC [Thermosulfidibacter takaii ABI70S6]|uniref:Cell shape-determining protein MreC n=1 Tax=Thermosulfidibacter takaii (strain DSM 17441 / JCM 13301 / NBRC 103674 / ABI70S6) TaxID=1298851 RepID=A0A0S3QTS9_THET7|nr:rod shape-determining protein MreC [Thermosulfidibacter takaii]BAT71743.1 rod shape-determining protein MreC [Thermosulfidibacter takaii ABI70S6]
MKKETATFIILIILSIALITARIQVNTISTLPEVISTKIIYLFQNVKKEGGETVRSIVEASKILEENKKLLTENMALKQKIALCNSLKAENLKLQKLLGIKQHYNVKILPARVLGWSGDYWQLRFILDKGAKDGVKKGMAVVGSNGIVGQIREVFDSYSIAMSVIDPEFSAHVEDTRSKVRGVARGNGRIILVDYIPKNMDIRVGDLLVSTGIGGIFPTGLYLGRVSKVAKSLEESFLIVEAVPTDRLENNKFVLIMGEGIATQKKD